MLLTLDALLNLHKTHEHSFDTYVLVNLDLKWKVAMPLGDGKKNEKENVLTKQLLDDSRWLFPFFSRFIIQ